MPAVILGLTGTNGKTTTKEFATSLISTRFKVHASKGSFNNHWGVPMSLLAISPADQIAIIEMGMNHLGELRLLSSIAEPDVVLVTMVGRGHLEGLGTIEGVAKAKAEIYESARVDAVFGFNIDNPHTRAMFERFSPKKPSDKILTFSHDDPRADVSLQLISMHEKSLRFRGVIRKIPGEAEVPVFGAQNMTNLMAAATLALAAGLTPEEVWKAFPQCHTVWGRNQWVNIASGARVLFDGYNANPESMKAALDNFTLLKSSAGKFAVLGEMKEMGGHALELHRALGEHAARAGFAGICFCWPE
jgi:UDP-N-acetylmuramoyl-tripeptide--D-alanyl-D-alanine ligase